jgi:hypothetical protein
MEKETPEKYVGYELNGDMTELYYLMKYKEKVKENPAYLLRKIKK